MCIYLMFKMDFLYAFLALVVMVLLYLTISAYKKDTKSVATLFRGVVYQFNRRLHVFLQKAERESDDEGWRPALVCVSSDSFKRFDAFEMLKWISHRYGFGTYIHHIEGYVSRETNEEANDAHEQLINLGEYTKSKVYIDTIISPSYTSAIAQIIQLPGFSGKDNNMIMFEYNQREEENLEKIMENFPLVKSLDFDVCMLASSDKKYGYMRTIHVWLSPYDLENANLMILMAYIILGHPDWRNGEIKIFAVFPADELDEQRNSLSELVRSGRLPISAKNIELIPKAEERKNKDYILEHSHGADLTIVGFRTEMVKAGNTEFFLGYDEVGNVLFVNSGKRKHIG